MEDGGDVTSTLKVKTVLMLREDLKVAQEKFNSEEAYVEDISFDGDTTVNFKLLLPSKDKASLALVIPDDYPREPFILFTPGQGLAFSSDMKNFPPGRLYDVFPKIIDSYWKGIKPSAEECSPLRDRKKNEEGKKKKKKKRAGQGSKKKKKKPLNESAYVDEEEHRAPYFKVDEEEAAVIKARLESDIAAVKRKYGKCGLYCDPVTREYIVRLKLSTTFMDKWGAAAVSVDNKLPIIAELQFSWQYLNQTDTPPRILSLVQSGEKNLNCKSLEGGIDFGLQWLFNNRLSDALRRDWVTSYRNSDGKFLAIPITEEDRKRHQEVAPPPPTEKETKTKKKKGDKEKGAEKDEDGDTKKKPGKKRRGFRYAAELKALKAEKFDSASAELALLDTFGNLKAATRILKSEEALKELKANASVIKDKEQILSNGFGGAKKATKRLEHFLGASNFLIRVADYLHLRMRTYALGCIICDGPLGYKGVKPTVCSKPLCNHSFDNYGLGMSLMGEIKNHPEVVDLLISITCGAALNRRSEYVDVFVPFPDTVSETTVDKATGEEKTRALMVNKVKDYKLVADVCNKIPSMADLNKFSDEKALRVHLDSLDKLCIPLLRWIVQSNSAHLTLLPEEKHIQAMNTKFQFVLISDNPQKEAAFKRKRQKHGSFYAFHGSALGNWHSIFRGGLKNYSNTDKMSAGAAYGAGIYMAQNASTSFGYVRPGITWNNTAMAKASENKENVQVDLDYYDYYGDNSSFGGPAIGCICLGEVIDKRKRHFGPVRNKHGIYVVKDESLVVTRYFFVYPADTLASNRSIFANADSLQLPKDIYE